MKSVYIIRACLLYSVKMTEMIRRDNKEIISFLKEDRKIFYKVFEIVKIIEGCVKIFSKELFSPL